MQTHDWMVEVGRDLSITSSGWGSGQPLSPACPGPSGQHTTIWCILLTVWCYQHICWGCRFPIIQSVNEGVKEVQTQYWPLVTLLQSDFMPLTTTSLTIWSSSWCANNFFMRILWEILQLLFFCSSFLRFFPTFLTTQFMFSQENKIQVSRFATEM